MDETTSRVQYIRKRDGRILPFDPEKITDAIFKAAKAVGGSNRETAQSVCDSVVGILDILHYKEGRTPTVEKIGRAHV